ncbi:MAG: DUF4886 domain-containing protein [Paludibacter sp.]|nr:DUF4886 domain-containing protein [Paludibacter sp.]
MHFTNTKLLKAFLYAIILSLFSPVYGEGVIKILAIGNSFSEDAAESYVDDLVISQGENVIIGHLCIGGSSLDMHWGNAQNNSPAYSYRKIVDGVKTTTNNKTMKEGLQDEAWDYITFQQVSQASGKYATYFPYLPNLLNYAKKYATNPNVQYCLHRTWAYTKTSTHSGFLNYQKDQMIMYDSIVTVTNKVAEKVGINIIIPAGTAIQNGRSSYIGDNFNRDGFHLSLGLGRFTASCVWYEKLFGKSVLENTLVPSGITSDEAKIAKNAAHYAVLHPDEVTSMADFTPDIPTELNENINVNFGGASNERFWNNIVSTNIGYTVSNLTDKDGNSTGISIEINDAFGGLNSVGPTTTSSSFNIPPSVTQNSFWGNAGKVFQELYEPTAGFNLSGLNVDKQYDFNFFSSRTNVTDNRETTFTVIGENQGSSSIDAANNTSNIATVTGIKPKTDGTITISIGAGANNSNEYKFFYLNAMVISPVVTSGMEDLKTKAIEVYPNPIKNMLNIKGESELANVEIVSVTGERIFLKESVNEHTLQLDLNWLDKGYYILKTKIGCTFFIKN